MARVLRIVRVPLVIVGSLVAVVVGLVVLVFVLLAVPPLRAFAVEKGLAYTNESVLDGMSVKVGSVDRIDPWGVNVKGIQLFDDKQREMVNVKWVLVRLNPFALIHNTLALTRVEVDDVKAHLYPPEAGPPEPEEPEQPSGESTFTIRAEHVRVRAAELTMDWSGRTLHAVVGTLAAGGQWGPAPALAIQQLNARATADDEELLRMHTTEGAWTAEKGGRVGLEALVAGANMTLNADVQPLDDVTPWPIRTASLRLENLTRRSLTLLGVTDGAELKVPVSLALDAKSQGPRLDATAKLRGGQARIDITASADDEAYLAAVDIAPVRLATVAGILPDMKVQGDLRARATPTQDTPQKYELTWRNVKIDDGNVPGGVARATLAPPLVKLEGLTLTGMEDNLSVHGQYNTETSAAKGALALHDFKLHAIEWLQKSGMAGTLNGGLEADVTKSALAGKGDLSLVGFKHPSASVDALQLGFGLAGTPQAPQGHGQLRVDRIAAGEVKLDQVHGDISATLDTLTGRLQLRGPDTLLNAELGGQRTDRGDLRAQAIGRGKLFKKDVRFDLRELLYGQNGVTVQELSVYSGVQSIRLGGSLDQDDHVLANLTLTAIDLAEWAKLAGQKGIAGKLEGKIKLDGTTAEPRVDAKLAFQDVEVQEQLPISGTLALQGDLGTRKADLQLAAYSTEELGARITLGVALPKRPAELSRAAQHAHVDAKASIYMPLEQVSAIAGDALAGLGGTLEANLTAEGTLDAPKIDAEVIAAMKLPEQKGEPEEAVRVTANISKDQGKVGVWAKDDQGELLLVDGFVAWPGGNPRAALEQPAAWQNAHFQLNAEMKPRRLDTMQGAFAYFSKIYTLSLPLRAGGTVRFEGNQGKLEGGAKAQLVIYGDKLDGHCRIGAESSVDVDARLKQDRVEVDLKALTDGGGTLEGKVESALALNALSGQDPVIGPAKVTLDGKEIAIHKLPGLCNLADGRASFTATATGLGKQRPDLDLKADIVDLRAHGSEPLSVEAKAHAGGKEVALTADLKSTERPIGHIGASVPLTYPDDVTPTVLPNAPIQARVQLTKLPLANVLAFTEALGRVSGTADADLAVSGRLDDPYPVGFVQIADMNVSVAALAQPFRDVNGRFEVKGRSVKIPKLTARDRDGKLTIEGFATLRQDMTGDGGVYLEADKFPLRQQGTVVGELTTRARFDMKIPEDLKAEAQLKILDGRIWLTGDRGKNVQSLDAHPDVRFADDKIEHESTPAEEAAEAQKGQDQSLTIGEFKMKTDKDLWLMHKDFSLQVGVDIGLVQGESGPKLEGEATLHRGELKLLGKPFKISEGEGGGGAIRFTGDMPPNPELNIKAVYDPPTGENLIVQVTGRAMAPVLEFSGAATNAGEAVAVLTGVGAGSAAAQQKSGSKNDPTSQMASIAADMTAGLLIMTARREYGDWVPMISVETGESGQPTSARAGFDASKLIPPWLEGIAKGAYVEGIVGQTPETNGSVGFGVRLDVAMPRDIVTSLGYGPGPGWSTDVAWSP